MANDLQCGSTWRASWAKYDRVSCSWKTPQCSLFEDLDQSLPIWPQWGMAANGECWALPTLAYRTKGTGSGWLPTPLKADSYLATYPHKSFQRAHSIASLPECVSRSSGMRISPTTHELLMNWPDGWTDLQPLETDRFQQWLQAHGACLEGQ